MADLIKSNRKCINYMSQFSAEYCELYVDLICLHEPEKLLNFLKTSLSDYSCRIEECLRICRERQVWDAAAYLLEKSGQIEAAFTLNLEKLSNLMRDLQKRLSSLDEAELSVCKSNIDANLVKIIQLCQRNSQSLNDSVKERVWFSLFDEVMRPIQSLCCPNSESRLIETRDFLKKLGSHIINSMVGYLSLTTIIDRIVCDPMYGASNFGDIKYLISKMYEMCSYEQVLLDRTASLASRDVYSKMATFKRYACKSYSAFSIFCQFCSKPLDLSDLNDKQSDLNEALVSLFHCGHSFHLICLEMIQVDKSSACPICNSSSSGDMRPNKKVNRKQQVNANHAKQSSIDYGSVQPTTSAAALAADTFI